MSPQKQAAQTANAQKSHGATTEAGRARSSQNSIRHSLCSKKYFIVPEDRPEFDIYYNDLIAALAPEGAVEALLAEAIILDAWRLTRARLVENQIFCSGYMSCDAKFAAGAETWLAHSKEFATLTLYEQRINRVLTRNKAEFESRQAARSGAGLSACALSPTGTQALETSTPPAQPIEPNPETATAEPGVGFVHSSATAPPTPGPQPLTQSPETSESPTQPADSKPETAAPEPSVGLVHSSDVPPPAPGPQPLTPAAKRPHPAGGFVHSSGPVALTGEPLASAEPAPTPPAVARRAA